MIRKQSNQVFCKAHTDTSQGQRQQKLRNRPQTIEAQHAPVVSMSDVLGQAHQYTGGQALPQTQKEGLRPHPHVVAGNRIGAQLAEHPLHQKAANIDHRLLDGSRPGKAYNRFSHCGAENQLTVLQRQGGASAMNIAHTPAGGEHLAGHRRHSHALNSHFQHAHQQHIQRRMKGGGHQQDHKGHPGIAIAAQHSPVVIVQKAEDHAPENDAQILHRFPADSLLRPLGAQNGLAKQNTYSGDDQHQHRAADQGRGVDHLQPLPVLRPAQLGRQHPHADGGADDQGVHNVHHGGGHADSGQRQIPQELAHHHGVHNVIQLLKDIAQNDREGKNQHGGQGRTGQNRAAALVARRRI